MQGVRDADPADCAGWAEHPLLSGLSKGLMWEGL